MMRDTFTYSITGQELEELEKINFSQKGSMALLYIMSIIYIVTGVYNAVSVQDYLMLFWGVVFALFSVFLCLYGKKIRPKKTVEKLIRLDSSCVGERKITVCDDAVEFSSVPKENEPMVIGIYPFSVINTVEETENFFKFYMSAQTLVLPKRAVPEQFRENVFKTLRSKPNYLRTKK